jgi:N-acetylglucosamine-6-sulfatase
MLTGKYPHNTGTVGNKEESGCNTDSWRLGPEKTTFATHLQSSGYDTLFAGKYLNRYGLTDAGGIEHVPPGWSHWRALKGNSVYYNYSLSVDGVEEMHGNVYEEDYLTDVIQR